MSDALEKVKGIKQLPLFPLPLVLLPNELLPLHIFEPRYKQLLDDVQQANKVFGVTLFEPEGTLLERPPVGSIGCVAEIRESQTLPDGRSNIITMGLIRYRLLDYLDADDPYLIGEVEFFEDDLEDDEARLKDLADEVFELFERVAKAAFQLSGSRGQFPEIPKTDPEHLSFMITVAFNLESEIKYQMLEITSTTERLTRLRDILLQTVTKMEETAEIHKLSQGNGHTKKKIDI